MPAAAGCVKRRRVEEGGSHQMLTKPRLHPTSSAANPASSMGRGTFNSKSPTLLGILELKNPIGRLNTSWEQHRLLKQRSGKDLDKLDEKASGKRWPVGSCYEQLRGSSYPDIILGAAVMFRFRGFGFFWRALGDYGLGLKVGSEFNRAMGGNLQSAESQQTLGGKAQCRGQAL